MPKEKHESCSVISSRSHSKSSKHKKPYEHEKKCSSVHGGKKKSSGKSSKSHKRSRSRNEKIKRSPSSVSASSTSSRSSSKASRSSDVASPTPTTVSIHSSMPPPLASYTEQNKRSIELIKTLEARREREHKERRQQKAELKEKETPEEKRARRLLEKKAKEERRRKRMGWDSEYSHYSNDDNPFGDSNLTATFRWNKKLEREGLESISNKTVEVLSLQKQIENKRELEKVKKRRMERELERQQREDDAIMIQRAKEAVQFREWQRQEDKFHLEQARLRSEIRIRDGRAKPIDLLAQYISGTTEDEAIEMQMHEPYMMLNGLTMDDLEDLLVDIKVYVDLEKEKNIEFWNDMVIIVEDEIKKQIKIRRDDELQSSGRREGIHQCVIKDVADIFRGKSAAQLDVMRIRIEHKIKRRSEGVDVSYWESLLSQLKAYMARARLRDHHQEVLREKLLLLKKEPENEETIKIKEEKVDIDDDNESVPIYKNDNKVSQQNQATELAETTAEKVDAKNTQNNTDDDSGDDTTIIDTELEEAQTLYAHGNYSPKYIQDEDLDSVIKVIDEFDLVKYIFRERVKVVQVTYAHELVTVTNTMTPQERQMYNEARKHMLSDEAEFAVEAPIEAPALMATDKYRPRKPRYFNRVHTGFEWNKYNQTHYDMDNPPPKIVQGYKFNIFYPDLMNKSKTPQYSLVPCEDNPDFAILRFHTGPPYEDIAFKIVNREWEFSYKRGFRCQFHNNIFQLWFHFKRYRYRR